MSYWPQPEPADECTFQIAHSSYFGPAEYCQRDTIDGTDKCAGHTEQDPDLARDWANEQAMEN